MEITSRKKYQNPELAKRGSVGRKPEDEKRYDRALLLSIRRASVFLDQTLYCRGYCESFKIEFNTNRQVIWLDLCSKWITWATGKNGAEARHSGSRETGCKGTGEGGAPLQMSRLEMVIAWRGNEESWMDSRDTKEGEEGPRLVPRSLPVRWVMISLWAGEHWGRKRRVWEEDNQFSLSHRGCVRPLIAWHQPPSPTCFCIHSPLVLTPACLWPWASCCSTSIL